VIAMAQTPTPDTPPVIAPWVLSIRLGLEVGSLIAIGAWARRSAGHGALGWAAAIALPLVVAVVWGTFAVPDDPSRSGKAPVPVSGGVRLGIEMAVFFGGAAALGALDWWPWFDAFIAAFVVHHAGAMQRLQWLSRQK
jgi:Protein of unknown function (DUF2568)